MSYHPNWSCKQRRKTEKIMLDMVTLLVYRSKMRASKIQKKECEVVWENHLEVTVTVTDCLHITRNTKNHVLPVI